MKNLVLEVFEVAESEFDLRIT